MPLLLLFVIIVAARFVRHLVRVDRSTAALPIPSHRYNTVRLQWCVWSSTLHRPACRHGYRQVTGATWRVHGGASSHQRCFHSTEDVCSTVSLVALISRVPPCNAARSTGLASRFVPPTSAVRHAQVVAVASASSWTAGLFQLPLDLIVTQLTHTQDCDARSCSRFPKSGSASPPAGCSKDTSGHHFARVAATCAMAPSTAPNARGRRQIFQLCTMPPLRCNTATCDESTGGTCRTH
jgi:hypothetical protein